MTTARYSIKSLKDIKALLESSAQPKSAGTHTPLRSDVPTSGCPERPLVRRNDTRSIPYGTAAIGGASYRLPVILLRRWLDTAERPSCSQPVFPCERGSLEVHVN